MQELQNSINQQLLTYTNEFNEISIRVDRLLTSRKKRDLLLYYYGDDRITHERHHRLHCLCHNWERSKRRGGA